MVLKASYTVCPVCAPQVKLSGCRLGIGKEAIRLKVGLGTGVSGD